MRATLILVTTALLSTTGTVTHAQTDGTTTDDPSTIGHSQHGDAFDEGPRQKPWKMEGIGASHFPITTSVPEVQEWFDQGHTLLHSFWWFEAERAFRWCLKLDPDCAMAWWGLARATGGRSTNDRAEEFLREAVLRKQLVTPRERMYIEAWENALVPELSGAVEEMGAAWGDKSEAIADELELIILEYPDDMEAKALFGLYSLYRSSRYGNELIFQEIFADQPEHPGAHHYRIHNWDGPEGLQALASCAVYGRIAWDVGHANHMPGHIYSGVGLWHEGAIWMDSATRVEKRYMQQRMIFPFNAWNYSHNRNYLAYIQEQLGMPSRSLDGARQLLAAPRDPEYNKPDGSGYGTYSEGMRALVRALVKFERWETILEEGAIPWSDTLHHRTWRAYCETLAHIGLGDVIAATDSLIALKELEAELEQDGGGGLKRVHAIQMLEARALLALAQEESIEGMSLLSEAAQEHFEKLGEQNDPPSYPRILYNVMGDVYLDRGAPGLALGAFEKVLEIVPNDGFALSGLTRAHAALGDVESAAKAYGELLAVWSDAEPGLRWMEAAAALGIGPTLATPEVPQRNYARVTLAELGPNTWKPYAAPMLRALDTDNFSVTLEDYRGKNVVLVFFLGEQCPHCVDQLVAIDERADDFEERDTVVLAISSDTPEMNRSSLKMGELSFRLISDLDFANARRFKSYDDFEDMELHSTNLIDKTGRIRWARTGGDPFMELDFLMDEIDRVNEDVKPVAAAEASAPAGQSGR